MEIKFEQTKENFVRSVKALINLYYKRILLFSTGIAIAGSLIDGFQHGFKFPDFFIVLICLFFFSVFVMLSKWLYTIYKGLKKFKIHSGLQYIYSIHPEGLKLEMPNGALYFRWFNIRRAFLIPDYMVVNIKKNLNHLIPISAFESQEQVNIFLNSINRQSAVGELSPPKPPSYRQGLFGLIPIVGSITGVIMIIEGITKYKDKKYTLIGLAGVLFTFALYYESDIYKFNLNNLKFIRQQDTVLCQMDLKALVKEIEFYKLQKNVYPDSLQQLNLKKDFTTIYDPILSGMKNDLFLYHKIGNKYTLFSVGVDEKPNTADDIYPAVDTSKTGLIIRSR